jgi:hypothetical protein
MKLRNFVSGSALVLAGWLAATFMYDMPAQRYQKLDKFPETTGLNRKEIPVKPAAGPVAALAQVSGSH